MPLNKSKGNMYPFVTHTWNTIKGKCPHNCSYCYMKRFGKQPDLHFDKKELKTDLGSNNFIFVGSSCDMWAQDIPKDWIRETLDHCINSDHRKNTFLFQTKNSENYFNWMYPRDVILGVTIETNRIYPQMGETPSPHERSAHMTDLGNYISTMVTIEPIMDFDMQTMIDLVVYCNPRWVNIGADSQGHHLPEPEPAKIDALIVALKEFTQVKIKSNLKRLYK